MPRENMHGRLQWYLDCCVEADLEPELRRLATGTAGDVTGDVDEVALKTLAVGLLYAVEEGAAQLAITAGDLKVKGEAGTSAIATPPASVLRRAVEIVKEIGDLGGETASRVLSLGLRGDEVQVTAELTPDGVTLDLTGP